jgi:hypothetical protein
VGTCHHRKPYVIQGIQKCFLTKYWLQQCQVKVRLIIYQDKYHLAGGPSYCDHLMKYAVKAKHLDPPMSPCEFLRAMCKHYSLQACKAWVVSKPTSLQEAAAFLAEVEVLDKEQSRRVNTSHRVTGEMITTTHGTTATMTK